MAGGGGCGYDMPGATPSHSQHNIPCNAKANIGALSQPGWREEAGGHLVGPPVRRASGYGSSSSLAQATNWNSFSGHLRVNAINI